MTTRQILNGVKVVSRDALNIAKRQVRFYRKKPEAALLFLTYRCDSACKTCTFWMHPQTEREKEELGVPEWKGIIDQLAAAGVKVVEVFGGNVLLRKDLLIAVLRHLREKGIVIHLPTNQIGMDDRTAGAIMNNVDFVYLSIDGVGQSQDSIRGRPDAGLRLEDALARLVRHRTNACAPRLICNTTVSKYNVGLLEKITQYAIDRSFDEIHFEYVGEFTGDHIARSVIDGREPTPYFFRQRESALVSTAEAKQLKDTLLQIRQRFGTQITVVTVNIDTLSEQRLANGTIPYSKCYVERIEPVVDPSGNLVACPNFNNYAIGSLRHGSFDDLWDNAEHKKFRRYQNSGKLELCRHCILGMERNPTVYGSLRRIYFSRIAAKLSDMNRNR